MWNTYQIGDDMTAISKSALSVAALDTARVALFIDADHFRRCAARGHERLTGSRTIPSQVNIDGAGISDWVERASLELGLEGSGETSRGRSSRRIYDVLSEDRRQRWQQRRYHGVLEAEGFVVKAARVRACNRMQVRPRLDRALRAAAEARRLEPDVVLDAIADVLDRGTCSGKNIVEAYLATDLVRLTESGQIDTALLLAGDRAYAGAVVDARERGAEVIVPVPAASSALVAESLRVAATRAIALHPEVFETLYHVRRERESAGS